MATKYVTLKDSNGDTLYPQAVATGLVCEEVPLSDYVEVESGFTITDGSVFRQGRMYSVNLVITATNNFTSTQVTVAWIKSGHQPKGELINGYAMLGSNAYNITGPSYMWIVGSTSPGTPGAIIIADTNNTGKKCVKIMLTYAAQD